MFCVPALYLKKYIMATTLSLLSTSKGVTGTIRSVKRINTTHISLNYSGSELAQTVK